MRADIVPGGVFPDELTDHTKTRRKAWDAGDHSRFHPYQQADRQRPAAGSAQEAASEVS